MKRFALLTIAALLSVIAFTQRQLIEAGDTPIETGPVTPPADLETETYLYTGLAQEYNYGNEEGFSSYRILVQVGFDGDDVYIQGIATDMPELWVKATKNAAGQYVIPANQYMGDLFFWGYTFPYYFTAVDEADNCVDAVFDFDPETSTFTSSQTLALNGAADALDYYLLYQDVVITKFEEVAATPANPTFEDFNIAETVGYSTIYAHVPAEGTRREVLNTAKLYYIVWIEKDGEQMPYTFTAALYPGDFDEDVTEVPYLHDGYDVYKGGEIIYLEDEIAELESWTKVGIQSVYYGAGERRESDIVWSDGSTTTGINALQHTTLGGERFFDLQGRAADSNAKGLVIVQSTDSLGNLVVRKMVRK